MQRKINFDRNQWIEIIALIPALAFVFLTMYYWDNQTIFRAVLTSMNEIIEGPWYNIFITWRLPYGIGWQLLCGLWSLPILILNNLGLCATAGVGARLWYKLFMLIFLLLDTKAIGNVAEKMGMNEKYIFWTKMYFLSSLLVVISSLHIGQLDVANLFVILLGVEAYLDKKYWKFLLFFALANPAKYFAFFIFLPLVLLNEKRYLYIMRDVLVGGSIVIFERLWKHFGYYVKYLSERKVPATDMSVTIENNTVENSFVQKSISSFLEGKFEVFSVPVSVIVFLFGVLCIWCYTRHEEDEYRFKKLAISVCYLGFFFLFAFGTCSPYWLILWSPFALLLIMDNKKNHNILLPLSVLIGISYLYIYILDTPWILGSSETFDNLVVSLLPGYFDTHHSFIKDFLNQRGLDGFKTVFAAIWAACSIGIIYITWPYKKEQSINEEMKEFDYVKFWYWIRVLVLYMWIGLNIFVVIFNHM